eukprot:920750-Pleurochrysis_carterae.AAC.1
MNCSRWQKSTTHNALASRASNNARHRMAGARDLQIRCSKAVRGQTRSSGRTISDHARLNQACSVNILHTSTGEGALGRGGWARLSRSPVRGRRGRRGRPPARETGNQKRRGRARAKYTCGASANTA